MASPRSLIAARHSDSDSHTHDSFIRRSNGRFWSKRSMSGHSPEATVFPLRSMFSPIASPTEMSRPQGQTSPTSLSASQTRHSPASDYADKIFYKFHHHSISDSVATPDSNDSSPTTTMSTVDDSSATETSPGSSPESPPPSSFTVGMLRERSSDETNAPFFELQKQPPPRKGRNLKNLAVNTARHTARAASTTSLPLQPTIAAESPPIASPGFVKPPSPPKRKPSNLGLTLLTPGSSKIPPQEIKLAIPPTPGFSRPGTLRHFQSSPSLPLFPGLASRTGLGAGPSGFGRQSTLPTIISPIEPAKQIPAEEEEEEQNFDVPLSKEEKPEAYPDGPICVYDPNIDLYLEPTAEQAREYDVIMNVASEVRNPLVAHHDPAPAEPDIRIDGGGGIQYAPRRAQLSVVGGEGLAAQDNSPTTPKATPLNSSFPAEVKDDVQKKDPEYIHIPWEHNSDIVPDLLRLVKLIDDKVSQNKRVLVHCQCGVSRSASLVVAYGLYKDPTMSVQEAYDIVKKRSKWIGPNMNLIMQLQEFRTSLTRGGLLPGNRGLTPITPSSAISEWRSPFSLNPSDPIARSTPFSAGLAPTTSGTSQDSLPAVSPGPSSAPSGLTWPFGQQPPPVPTQRARAISAVKPSTTAYVDTTGHIVPVLKLVAPSNTSPSLQTPQIAIPEVNQDEQEATPTEAIQSPRSAEFAMTSLNPSQAVDSADSFGLMSPTSTEFASSPFDRSILLASLGMGSVQQDEAPRRSMSLLSRSKPAESSRSRLDPAPASKLRGKISSPSLREQQQLQSLQAEIEATLPSRVSPMAVSFGGVDEALMSPRATEFTKNPFALALTVPEPLCQLNADAPRSSDSDPRSPAQVGVSPITRNILDVL